MGFLLDVGRLAIWLVLLAAVFGPLEWLCAVRPAKLWRRQIGVDLCWYFINSLLPAAILSIPLAVLARTLNGIDPGGIYSGVTRWPLPVRLVLGLFVSDLGAYWGHRALHSRQLWRFHALHHSAEEMDWLVNTRAHPFDTVLVRFAGLTPIYLLGLARATGPSHNLTVAILTIFGTIWTFFIHSNIRVRLGALETLVSSPFFHHWHHTSEREHRNRNFAFVFPFIDRIFGTAWFPARWPATYGIDTHMPEDFGGQLFGPLEPKRQTSAAHNAQSDAIRSPSARVGEVKSSP